ncbi:MAG: non-ribosomal peptide synthase/polyketide synthase [Gemmatimonadota bacterium]
MLGTERVGVEEDFFALGGHSLLATQVVSRVRQAFGVELPLRALFEAPTVAGLAGRVEALRGTGAALAPPIERIPRDGPLPLSFAQQRLWLVDRLEPGSSAYNMPVALRLRGALDLGALRASLDALVRRHETLRTVFTEREGRPVQVIHPPAPVPLPVLELGGLRDGAREREAERIAAADALRPFDLERGPLLRSALLRLDDHDHVLCFNLHHVVSDGWSMQVLVREVSALYAAASHAEEPRLPELPVQYADYAVWQREWLTGEVLAEEIGYWKRRLAGAPPLLEIPTDRPRAAGQSARAARHAFALPAGLSRGLRELSRREGATLFMTLLAGWQALLARYSGQEDVVVGSPVAGRTQRETEGLIGFFVNMLALRADLSGDPAWTELLGRVREEMLGAYEHQELPFERLVDELRVERSLMHTPVFQTIFTLNQPGRGGERLELGGLALEPFGGSDHVAAKFDLDLVFSDVGGALVGALVFRAALFEPATVARLAGHLETVLEAIAADPAARLSGLSLLCADERAQLLAGSRAEPAEHAPACVHELFSVQAARTPELVAVDGAEPLTYAELERRSNRLARRLRGRGVGLETRVALCLERGPEIPVAVLAVLKAGGAYVPLDPAYPAERLAYTLADSGATMVVARGGALAALPPFGGEVVDLDADAAATASESDGAVESGAGVRNAAYVIYTSGSTGRPKGVVVEHAGLANTLLGTRDAFGPAGGETMPVLASYAFDIWGFEVFAPLLSGGRVRLLRRETVQDVERLVAELADADAVHAVPALMREVVARVQAGPGTLPRMRRVFVGGDAVPPDLIGQMQKVFPAAQPWVLYGPTETSILGAASPLRTEGCYGWQVVGRALPGVGLYVCDAGGNLLPDGVPGELWIGGAGVARGYQGRPELTAERFVPDPFAAEAGARLYRTGDRVRRRADGELEFLGRVDQQVKIRGFRIEPGEVEAALLAEEGVHEAVVVVREDVPGRRRLVAYVVAAEGAEVSPGELRARLARRLPEHMVPGAFVVLERLPLNANGKLDRRALPAPARESAEWVAPRTAAEEVLAGICAAVLGRERVGVEESFFDLGGHSLLATQVVSRVREAFGVELPLKALFEAPTVEGLAGRIEALRGTGAALAPPMERIPRDGPLPLSFAQQRLWLVDRLEPGSSAYNMPVALRLRGALDLGALRASLDALVRRHETLRTVFTEREGRPVQVIHPPAPVPLPVLELGGLRDGAREREAERIAAADALRPFDLERGPLLRSALLRLDDHDHVLCFNLHHVVSDGWSMQVLVREVSALYAAASHAEEPRLPELPVQYADFAAWQRSWLSGETLEAQLAYWKAKLAGAPPLLEIPTDRARAVGQSPRAASHAFLLSPGLSQGLRDLARREGATLFMTLLAAWQALLARYAGQEDVVVGTPIAGRNRRETEGLIGFFVNVLALRADLSGNPAWSELLGRVREATLGAYEHQELPFERLVEELAVERSLVYTPVFQATFALNRSDARDEALELAGVGLEPFGGGGAAAKFDLGLVISDSGGALGGALVYRRGLYEARTIARMAGHLEATLEALAADSQRRLSELSLLRGAERVQVLEAWNATAAELPRACVHVLFAGQAARTPEAPAVLFRDEVLAYGELERRADRLAHLLRERGAGPEVRVGVCLERGVSAVLAMLAILKAGAAYVPVAPSDPAERLREVFADAGVRLVLSESAAGAHLPGAVEPLWLDAAETAAALAAMPEGAPRVVSDPSQLAYVIYTSGSTGRPKGVAVSHTSVVRLVRNTDYVPFGPEERIAHASNLAFDAATFEIWGALLNGGSLAVVERETTLSPAALVAALREREVTTLFVTTALFNRVAHEEPGGFGTLRHLLFGGEAVDPASVRRVLESGAPGRLLHVYGPTETTTYASRHLVRGVEPDAATVPIGGPLGNTTLYVLDAGGEALPAGLPGELYVGGPGVARGYLGRPKLTVEKFVPDPFSAEAGARLYRTGDRVRWTAAGEIEFLGRVDQQVKIRGFRIEPGEVEAALLAEEGVHEAVVLAREDAPGDRRLVAYVVAAEGGAAPTAAELRAGLRQRLPEHMVPGAFVLLESIPLTANGKVDRRALPAPERGSAGAYAAPRTATEGVLAGIWAEVLRTERVGVLDNFFELGGHSLLATQVVSRVWEAFGVEVPLKALFEVPTVAGLAGRIEALRGNGAAPAPPIGRVARDEPLPLSFAQQRLWIVDRIEPGSPAYNMPVALRLRGALDQAMLRASLDALVRRHETLRTTFAERGGAPVQVTHPPAPVPLPTLELGGLPAGAREREAERIAGADALRPFDLARGPLLRTMLLRLAPEDHVLCFNMHHVVSDGWSMQVLVREVSALYAAFCRGEEPRLPELPVQYADFAVWQRAWLSGETLEAQLAYWRERLAGAPPLLEIPVDRPRRAGQSPRAESHRFTLPPELSRELRELSRREGATLFMTLLAAWQALLGRYAGQEDVVVGTPIAGRNRRETEGLIGFFVNVLALRADLSGDPAWSELVGRVREATLGAYEHQELPFERLVEELAVERSLMYTPVFQTTFTLDVSDGEDGRLELGGLALESFGRSEQAAKHDLALLFGDGGTLLGGALVYRPALFDAGTVARMAEHLQASLEAMVEAPRGRLSGLSLLREAERAQLLDEWNATAAAYPLAAFHELFAEQAGRTPESTALAFEGAALTYAELERAANRLAGHLRRRGVGPETRVGICLDRGLELVVAVLGVLKAGGVYVPLDPAYPAERTAFMLADSGTSLLLTRLPLLDGLPPYDGETVCLDADGESIAGEAGEAPPHGVEPRGAAYLLYTSGSTGRPKGVIVEHGSLAHFVATLRRLFEPRPAETALVMASFTFDIWVLEALAPLAWGAAVRLLPLARVQDPDVVVEVLRSMQAMNAGPALMREIVAAARRVEPGALAGVRWVFSGGEAVTPDLWAQMREVFPAARLIVGYGPTEATVLATTYPIPEAAAAGGVTIGRPLPNVRVYVLDAGGRPQPVGVPGELLVGGPGVARGYHGRAEQTAEAFVPDGFGCEGGGRLYRTGDRVRWLADGNLEFLGRLDAQVKIRGFRVEPGEVEAALLEQEGVREAVVAVREDAPGRRRLVAYVVPEEGAEVAAGELRARLGERLPEHMVPAAFVTLARLPLNANGKVDRRALPAPEREAGVEYVAPRTATEEVLAGIWAEVLRVERVGSADGFFELGGHSLLATQVVSRAREAFGVEVPLKALFEAQTVAALAGRIDALRSAGTSLAPPIERIPRDEPLPLSFAQQRLWLMDRIEPGSPAYNMPIALRLRGVLDLRALRASLDALVRRHETLRTTFAERGGAPVQVIHPPAPVPLPSLELGGLPAGAREREAERLAQADALRPFDLARGPLLRSTLLRLAPEDHVLCFNMHHVVSDGWSMQVLVREVSALYAASSRGEEPRLPELPVQYADYAVWQRGWLSGDTLEAQIGYWRERLSGAPPLLEVPTDHPRAPRQSPLSESHRFTLSPELSRGLRELSRREGATLFMTLLAGWQALLGRYAGQEIVVVGSAIAGRNRRETEGLIGFFVNMLALRGDLAGDPTFAGLLGRVRQETLGAYDHQDLPFERLVEELRVERSLTHQPVFQAIITLDQFDAGGSRLELGELGLESFGQGAGAAKYDLDLVFGGQGEGLGGRLVYRPALFDAATIERMAAHLVMLLEQVVLGADTRISELGLLGEAERRRVVEEWNRTAAEFPADRCIHQLFEEQAARTPGAVAVLFGGESLTYAELDERADRLARHLAGLGVGPEVRVGLCLERSLEVMVAILGVLKAGGAYVPVDPAHPGERIAYVLEDSEVALVLTQERLLGRLPAVPAVRLDAEWERIAAGPAAAPESGVTAENLCYVIYTSGSTGRPKGVAMHHRGVCNYIDWGIRFYGADHGTGAPVFSSLAVDLTITNLLPLFAGHPVHFLPEESPVETLAEVLREKPGFGLIKITPTHLALLAPLITPEEARAAAKTLVIGADLLSAETTLFMQEHAPEVRLMNEYGPTETVVGCSAYLLPNGVHRAGAVPVGGPIQNLTFFVLDAALGPVPVGLPGELYIGGVGVARGYLGRPELSSEKFVPDPFAGAGARMYRTGDRARWLEGGNLLILGRVDNQVKVRGYRVELGEIEAALRKHRAVSGCVVVLREDVPGDRRLVAYVVPEAGEVDAGALREHLRRSLPEYMVPSAFVRLDSLPNTTTGKFDPRSLPAPAYGGAAERYVAPRTLTEEVLAGVWAEVLQVERVGAADGFFELGGHSLLATQVVSRVREAFGVELPLRALFEAQTLAALAGRIDALRSAGTSLAPPIERVPRDGPLPLSFAQQRLWLVDRIQPGSPAYNMPYALRLRGALDLRALRASLDALVRRHEPLRTTFAEQVGRPVQVIHPPAPVPLPTLELGGLPAGEREREAERLAGAEALRPFDLARGPLLRSTLLRLAGEDHVICFTLHHVVSDGWSMQVLVREVSVLYAAFCRGEEPRLPELPVQYADFAVWQRAWLRGETLEAQLAYWRERLAGAPPVLELPTDFPRPPAAEASGHGGSRSFMLSPGTSQALRALGRAEGATLFMTLLAAWQLLLARYAGQEDVVVGTPIAGRTRLETEGLIGFFANTLVLRTGVEGAPDFSTLLARVREGTLGAYAHQDLPFERLVEELQPERMPGRTPLFQVMFSFQNLGQERLRMGELAVEALGGSAEEAVKFDLNLTVGESGEAVGGRLAYPAELYEDATAERMLEHLRVLLEGIVADPGRSVREIDLLGEGERRQVVEEWNATDAPFPEAACVHDLFEAQAERTPDAPAVVHEGGFLTYAELDRCANRLARFLRGRGVGPDSRVALCLERGPEMMVALLGILKSGGAYVPLDPRYPAGRLAYMLESSAAPVLLTQASLAGELPASGAEVVRLDADRERFEGESDAPLRGGALPDSLAYVVYTSGSTGVPKGVAMPHRPLVNLLAWQERDWRAPAPAATLQFATISFDASFHEVFSAWSMGGRVVLIAEEARYDPAAILNVLEREGVERLFMPAVALQHLAETADARGLVPSRLREVQTAGEALRVTEPMRRWLAALGAPLYNHYGPSETHVVTSLALQGDPREWPLLPSIGTPIANTRCYVLDERLHPSPVGVPGELYLAGASLARGYLGQAGLTAERFVPDPLAAAGGERMYRTGDRVRWLAAGEVEFLGRVDDQVKLRGFRIEPGEIEAALERHPQVREAVVAVREDAPGAKRLVGYVVPPEGAAVTPAELRAHLQGSLPEYMVPGAYVVLEKLPLTPSGKVDRRALPASELPGEQEYVAPRTLTEEVLAQVWAEVLQVERVGAADGFFELGGHSLLATQVVSRVREAFAVELPLRTLFEAQTLAALAGRIDALRSADTSLAPPIERVPRDVPLPLSFAQQRLWLVDRIQPGSPAYNMPYALRLRGALDTAALRASLDALVRRHEALRTTLEEDGGGPVQVVHPPARVPLPVLDLAALPATARERQAGSLAAADAMRPFDLARGPLLRSTLLRLAGDDHVLCFNVHHVVSDGWSMQVLVREVSALYAAFAGGEEPRLPELPVQYADYAVWQRAWLSGETLEAQVDFWKEQLAGAPPLLEIPTDRARAPGQSPRAARHLFRLPGELSRALRELSRREGATLFMTVLAAWQALLAKYSGQEDVVVGSPIAGRTWRETEGLIGFFVNMLALRGELAGDPTWAELLGRVRETALGAYAHQELPFERLVEELAVERSLTHSPIFQVVFSLSRTGAQDERLRLGQLEVEPFGAGESAAKFDLDLVVGDVGEELSGALAYREELFEAGTIGRIVGHLEAVLASIAGDPGRRLTAVSLLSAAERAQVLEDWNPTGAEVPEGGVHELFAQQAARTPGAEAVVCRGETLTYAALERRAGRLARVLRREGAGTECVVGILVEHSVDVVAALLGTLGAGGCCLLLDPEHPRARIASLLEDAGVRLVVAQPHLRGRLPSGRAELRIVELEGDIMSGGEDLPLPRVAPESAAYLVYTSGSTGRPKGVLVSHGAAATHLREIGHTYGLSPADRVLVFAAQSFDPFLEQALAPLLAGASVALRDPAVWTAAEFAERVESLGVTVVNVPPAYWGQLVRERAMVAALKRALRLVIVGGEALAPPTVQAWEEGGVGGTRLLNAYGPTEAVVTATVYEATGGGDGAWRASVPIGRAVAGRRTYVLDARGEPVPAGVPGELYVGGAALARGYLGLAEQTANRFVPDGFGGGAGGRLYRTGDRVRWLGAGLLEFLGRVDAQVKLRGVRIEPGEIEAVLLRHPGVREAVVVVREDVPGDRRLVAYLVPHAGAAAADLRAYLRERLPEYMVPGAFVELEALPLTPSGKTDRRALPSPGRSSAGRERGSPDPRDALETTLGGIFQEVLGIPQVGLRDSFFELGGHSLLAVQFMSRLEKATGVRLPVAALFRAPTVERLAEEVRRGGGGETPLLVPLRPGGSRTPLFLVHPVGGEVMAYAALTRRLHPEQPVYALRSRGIEPGEKPSWTVEEMARDYLAAIRRVQPAGPYRLGGWSMGGVVAYEMARQLEAAGEETEKLVLIDSQVPWLHDPKRTLPRDEILLVQSFAQDLGLAGERMPAPDTETRAAGELAYLRRLLEDARASGRIPGGLDLARMQHLYGIFRINLAAAYEYRPGSYGGLVTLLRASERRLAERIFRKKSMGWERVVRGLEVRMVPGSHYTMVREPRVEVLAREVERALGPDPI